jgi:exodeoxyribonuclease-3
VRIATWNVNGLKARLEFVKHWLNERKPDLVGLQELKLVDGQFPLVELEALGYHAAIHGQKGWNGVGILTRQPSVVRQRGLPGQDELGARLLHVELDGLDFVTIYCPNGKTIAHEDFGRKLAWLDDLALYAERALPSSRPVVLCGDFNLCPAPIDSWNEVALSGRIFHTDDERSRFRRLLALGLVDVFRARHPDTQAFSWWDYRAGAFHKKQGLRIDMLLASGPVMDRVRSVEIDREYRKKKDGLTASDHAPVIVDLA